MSGNRAAGPADRPEADPERLRNGAVRLAAATIVTPSAPDQAINARCPYPLPGPLLHPGCLTCWPGWPWPGCWCPRRSPIRASRAYRHLRRQPYPESRCAQGVFPLAPRPNGRFVCDLGLPGLASGRLFLPLNSRARRPDLTSPHLTSQPHGRTPTSACCTVHLPAALKSRRGHGTRRLPHPAQTPRMLRSGPNGKAVMFSAPCSCTTRMSCSR